MKRLSKDQLQRIVQASMPSYEVLTAEPVEIDGPLPAQMQNVGLDRIQEKLSAQIEPYSASSASVFADEDVIQAVEVVRRSGRFAKDRKTVLVSAAQEAVIGSQG